MRKFTQRCALIQILPKLSTPAFNRHDISCRLADVSTIMPGGKGKCTCRGSGRKQPENWPSSPNPRGRSSRRRRRRGRSPHQGRTVIGSTTSNLTSYTFTQGSVGNIPILIDAISDAVPPTPVDIVGQVSDAVPPTPVDIVGQVSDAVPPTPVDIVGQVSDAVPPTSVDIVGQVREAVPPTPGDIVGQVSDAVPPTTVDIVGQVSDAVPPTPVDIVGQVSDAVPPTSVDIVGQVSEAVPPTPGDIVGQVSDAVPLTPVDIVGQISEAVPPTPVDIVGQVSEAVPPTPVGIVGQVSDAVPPTPVDIVRQVSDATPPTPVDIVGQVSDAVPPSPVYIVGQVSDSVPPSPVKVVGQVNDATPPTPVDIIGQVAVTCEVSYIADGFSSGDFSTITLTNTARAGNVQITNLGAGRTVDVRCYGVSQQAGVTQFTRQTSISPPVSLTILNQPTVSICTNSGQIRVTADTTITQTFTLEFSDPTTAATQVTCSVTGGGGTISLNVPQVTVSAGSFSSEISYTYTSGSIQTTLTCNAPGYTTGNTVFVRLNSPSLNLYPQNVVTTSTKFSLLLELTRPPASQPSITLLCRADLYTDLTSAYNAVTSPPCTTGAPTSPPSATTPDWGVLDVGPLQPNDNIFHQRVQVNRNIAATVNTREYVVTSCCTTNLPSNFNTATLTVVDLTVNKSINYADATDPLNVNSERQYQNPAYVDVSPCPCDHSGGLCDINCCCDNDCSGDQQLTFSTCIEGLPGGRSPPHPDWDCDSTHFNKPDYFPLMCVQFEYNALLGFFYATTNVVRTSEDFDKQKTGEEFYSYRSSSVTTSVGGNYTEGASIQSVKLFPENSTSPVRKGTVVLPQRILGGECLKTAPVRYLNDLTTSCNYQLTTSMCTSGSVFSAGFYMESSNIRNPACPNSFTVLGNTVENRVAETTVNYHCATTTDLPNYVKSTTSVSPVTTPSLFDYTLPNETCSDTCGNDICTDFNSIPDAVTGSGLPTRCTFDNGFTRAPTPSISGSTCQNVVLDVRYNFYWSGSDILKLNATVILGDVPLNSDVTQKYSADFNHNFGGDPLQTSDNYRNVQMAFDRSGKPGYAFGKPVLSGSLVLNSTNNEFWYINTNNSRQLAVWNTGIDGLCFNAGRRSINFGEDVFSSCNIRLTLEDLNNCTELRKLVINRLNNLMSADRIGRFGNSNYLDLSHWIEIVREDVTEFCTQSYYQSDDVVLSYNLGGLCTNMISGIQIDIMYGESGRVFSRVGQSDRAYNQPIREIIGARISYINSTWQMSCSVGDSGTCNTTGYNEPFPITSTVRFIKVPANTPDPIQSYDQFDYLYQCQRDICWQEFIYPLARSYDAEPQEYVLGMVLVTIIFIVGLAVLMRPWWYII
ncbi:hypothetical protein FSP39_005349 [Pinctada imbricata]|uniref:Tectonic domain-containing protein n=1 Tax=Pinctada imbricata TaxID=66713 RepID=A0AA88XEQ3_PINIB|nr:hypothetical protein FSP39_005349 [Pinctada imbricata]